MDMGWLFEVGFKGPLLYAWWIMSKWRCINGGSFTIFLLFAFKSDLEFFGDAVFEA